MSQTKAHSLLESLNVAIFAAPTAIGLHKLLLYLAGDCALASADCNNEFVTYSWAMFFVHSVIWKYIIRRIHEKYNIELNPWYMIKTLKKKIKDKICSE